mgnify:CR=1 FL=1
MHVRLIVREKKVGLTKTQMNKAIKSSAVTSIGPSIVVLSGMLSLLVTVGGPVGWMRLSMIGSVMFESIGSGTWNISGWCDVRNRSNDKRSAYHGNLDNDPLFSWLGIVRNILQIKWKRLNINYRKEMRELDNDCINSDHWCVCCNGCKPSFKTYLFLMQKADAAAMGGANKNAIACILGAVIMYGLSTVAEKKEYWLVKENGH